MKVIVLFFASFKDRIGVTDTEIELPGNITVLDFKKFIVDRFPVLKPYASMMIIAVNRNFAFDNDLVPDSAEVAIFPPVSGGAREAPTVVFITDQEIDINALVEQITLNTTGAACIFSGMVRGITKKGGLQITDYLEYEAYVPMAEEKMLQVAFEIREKWPDMQGIALVQRTGILYPRTPTVFIACTAAHRDTGIFEAARYGIDRLKEIVPIWKKEIGSSGEVWIEGEYMPGMTDQ
jgi:MoaE-MoaD fusion protein